VLATDLVRYVGEPVAVVVADDPYRLADALEQVTVEYEVLPRRRSPTRSRMPSPTPGSRSARCR
jgi:CO/xanthine dehydrogenase Mo-binding subunit